MAVTVVQSKEGIAGSVTLASTTNGNTVVVIMSQTASVTPVAPTLAGFTVLGTNAVFASSADSIYILYKVTSGGDTSLTPTPGTGMTADGVVAIEIAGLGATPTVGTPIVNNNQSSTTNPSSTFSSADTRAIILFATGSASSMGTITYDAKLTSFTTGTTNTTHAGYSIPAAAVSSYVYTPNTLATGRSHANIVVAFSPTPVSASITQISANLVLSGGTQAVSASGGSTNASITQTAATVTASGGTQSIATTQIASITQTAANITASGGVQSVSTVNIVSISQVSANLVLTGNTQVVASTNMVSISQLTANLVITGGTQVVSSGSIVNASITQTTANLVLSGGTQSVATTRIVGISQTSANLVLSGGTQVIATTQVVSISQVSANLILSGGTQIVTTGGGAVNASIAQIAASLSFVTGTQIVNPPNAISQTVVDISAVPRRHRNHFLRPPESLHPDWSADPLIVKNRISIKSL